MPEPFINEIIASYGASAARLVEAGLDGCEILAGWGYLPSQFLSSKTNLREDGWGGDATRRQRFLREVLAACRAAVPEGFVVGVRLSIGEASPDGVTEEEALEAIKAYDADDLFDYVSVVKGTSGTLSGSDHIVPPSPIVSGYIESLAARVKQVTSKAVFLAGRINQPQEAEAILARGDADMCIMTRALITDPEMPAKAAEGRLDDIRACVGCNQACIGHFHAGYPISCIQFPETGRERFFPRSGVAGHQRHALAPVARRVLVIGGGPAGLKAASIAAERGHDVTLVEADRRLGGQVRLAQLVPGREEIGGVIGNLEREARAAGASIVLGVRADAAYVRAHGADVVIVATGALPYTPPLELMGTPTVLQAWDVLRTPSLVPAGGVVVADFRADWTGLGLATLLAGRGHRVTLAVNGTMAGQLCQQYVRDQMTAAARRARVTILTTTRVFGADTSAVFLQDALTEEAVVIEDASLVLAYGHQPADALLAELEADAAAGGYAVVAAGDVLSPRTIEEAVLEGLRTAYAI
jgi:NADPH-dependent 2,4-dienoyl-CoA reductase/sulfur reductase-like enzyme